MKVAWLGTGLMGAPMAERLLHAGHELTVWNRTLAKARPLIEKGARAADTPAAAVEGAEAAVTMLSDGAAVGNVLFDGGLAARLPHGSLMIDMSTIAPQRAREYARRLSELSHAPLDAPVSGGTRGAAAGTLTIMVGGAERDFDRAVPLLSSLGSPKYVGAAGSGQIAKAANQLIVAVTIGAVAEAFTLTSRAGVDPEAVREALLGGFADSKILREHGARMLQRDFRPGGMVRGQLKDLRIIEEVADALRLDLPLVGCVTSLYASLADGDAAGLDHSALLLEIERRNRIGEGP